MYTLALESIILSRIKKYFKCLKNNAHQGALGYNKLMRFIVMIIACLTLQSVCLSQSYALLSENEILNKQISLKPLPLGEKIAAWAESFVGTPYDTDPLGAYVTQSVIVMDSSADCMYLTFRSVELAETLTPESAINKALEKRFITKGILSPDGKVINYEERYQYAMDMINSGKWGRNITKELAETSVIPGDRGYGPVSIIHASNIVKATDRLTSGDIVFFVKDPDRRVVGEIVGHIGIIKREGNSIFLIHASGRKSRDASALSPGGMVKKLLLTDYSKTMPFAGIIITRLK
jgi:hypothetical protein